MNTPRKSDIYQANDYQTVNIFSTNESKNLMTLSALSNSQPWNSFLNNNDSVIPSKKNLITKNNWAKTVDDDYIWIVDDLNKTANVDRYRLAGAEIEYALKNHTKVQEVAVVGLPHEQTGNVIHAFVTLKEDELPDKNIKQELQNIVSTTIGKFAMPEHIEFINHLPKTSSGEVMRKALKAQALEKKLMLLN